MNYSILHSELDAARRDTSRNIALPTKPARRGISRAMGFLIFPIPHPRGEFDTRKEHREVFAIPGEQRLVAIMGPAKIRYANNVGADGSSG